MTKRSGVPSGRFWSRFTQYETHTDLSPESHPREPLRQFQLAQASRFLGIKDLSPWRYTSFGWYLIAPNAFFSDWDALEPRMARAWSEWHAKTTSSKSSTVGLSPPPLCVTSTPPGTRFTDTTGVDTRTSGRAAHTASTYALDRPLTTLHSGRSMTFSRWWLTQNRMSVTTGNCMVSLSEHDQMAAHMGTT